MQASEYKDSAPKERKEDSDSRKLLNIIYLDGKYYLHEPKNKDENKDNIIDNHLWLVMKFMPKKSHEVSVGDVVRFGRIPFKVTKLIADVDQSKKDTEEKENVLKRALI